MISKKEIADYDFDSIEEYYDYIVESIINGNFGQVDMLINDLSKKQKKECIDFLKDFSIFAYGEDANKVIEKIVESF